MAATYKLVCQYTTTDGGTLTQSFAYAMAPNNIGSNDVNKLMNAVITNNTLFKKTPVSKKAAYIVATEQTSITLS